MVLGGNRRDLSLRGPERLHVQAGKRRINVHEDAVWLVGHGARRRLHAFAEFHQSLLDPVLVADVPSAVESAEHQFAVRREHLLRAHRQSDLSFAGLQEVDGKVQGGAAAGAGIFHVDDRDLLDAHGSQRDLTANHVLVFHVALRRIGEVGRFQRRRFDARIAQRRVHGLPRKGLYILVRHPAEGRHPDSHDENIFHYLGSRFQRGCVIGDVPGMHADAGTGPCFSDP